MGNNIENITDRKFRNVHTLIILSIVIISILWTQTLLGKTEDNMISNTESTEAINAEAVNEAQRGKYDPAIKKFKNIITLQDQNAAVTYNNLGYTYLLNGDFQNALENFQKAVDRNPLLVPAIANLGKMLYQTGKYQEAIAYGEKTLTLDPQNANVRDWLPDAYKKAADKRMFDLQNIKKQEAKTENDKDEKTAEKKPASKLELYGIYELALDKATNTARHYGTNTTFTLPAGFNAEVWASPEMEISGELKTPSLGLYIPGFITSEERVSFVLHGKHFFYGLGAYFSQANFIDNRVNGRGVIIHNTAYPKRSDTKLGIIVGFQGEFNSLIFYTYPRFLFQDFTTGPQSIEFDRSITKLEYRVIFPEDTKRLLFPFHFELGFGLKTNEFFITEYNTAPSNSTIGHYFGTYDIYADITFGKIKPMFDKIPFQFGLILGSRFHFQDFDNATPFILANGQGYGGFNSSNTLTFTGPAFSAFKAAGFLIDIYSRQMFINKLVVTEKIGTEFTGTDQPYNGFNLTLSVAYTF